MKAIEQYFCCSTVHFALQGGSYFEIPKCSHPNESYWAALSCDTVHFAVQGGSCLTWVCGWNLNFWLLKWKLLSSTFQWYS